MKVLFVEPFGHREGHPSFESRRQTHALMNAGAEITLLTFMGVRGDWATNDARIGHIKIFGPPGASSNAYDFLNRSSLARSLLRIFETLLTISWAIWKNRKRRYDVVHVFDSEPAFFILLVFAVFLNRPNLVLTVYNPPPAHENWLHNLSRLIKTRRLNILVHLIGYELGESRLASMIRRCIYTRALRKGGIRFVCHTEQLVEAYGTYMNRIFLGRFDCIPLGIEDSTEQVPQEEARRRLDLEAIGKTVLLIFGNNHPGKDFEVVFKALETIGGNYVLLQAGKLGTAHETNDPVRLATQYGSQNRAVFHDVFVPENEKINYFEAADAVILSYKKDFIQSASIINDAAKFSVPVIASDVGQLGEFVHRYRLGLTFEPSNVDSLREAITGFMTSPQQAIDDMRSNAADFRREYTWEHNAARHLEVYRGGPLKSRNG